MISGLSILLSLVSIFSIFIACISIYYIIKILKVYKKSYKSKIYEEAKDNIKINYDPFILSFRRTRIETMITSKVDEISKSRDIQFIVSSYYYSNDRSIKGCIYIITSKVLYKLFFVKQSLIVREIHTFSTFISVSNKKVYNSIINYLDIYSLKQKHHMEFYTWPHYYFTEDYETQSSNIENFMKSL
jgi:hypothetical protein